MSVIPESQASDELVCVEEFSGSPQGERPSVNATRTFRIGERVRYLTYYRDKNLKDNPVCWMVVFRAADGKQYDATQTFFVTKEGWKKLEKYFAKHAARNSKRAKTSRD